ncbi:MAG: SoxR reducing system RseC family protein [Candidatus Azobacteroides sp.]|nr:SoxR reducing system RseC family protein [Candidatus Azobacteroides sp.]
MSSIIEHRGIIQEVFPDKVMVLIEQTSDCSGCQAKSICHASDKKDKLIEVTTLSVNDFKKDEAVNIQGKSSLGLLAVWYAFVLPLILMFVPLLIRNIRQNEAIASLTALSILAVYYLMLYACRKKLKQKFIFNIQKII